MANSTRPKEKKARKDKGNFRLPCIRLTKILFRFGEEKSLLDFRLMMKDLWRELGGQTIYRLDGQMDKGRTSF